MVIICNGTRADTLPPMEREMQQNSIVAVNVAIITEIVAMFGNRGDVWKSWRSLQKSWRSLQKSWREIVAIIAEIVAIFRNRGDHCRNRGDL